MWFSTTTVPRCSERYPPMMRAATSGGPPGPNGTISLIGCSGKPADKATDDRLRATAAASANGAAPGNGQSLFEPFIEILPVPSSSDGSIAVRVEVNAPSHRTKSTHQVSAHAQRKMYARKARICALHGVTQYR